ncbi:MAG: hypothetical protein K2H09_07115, partial [Treponemataceae bacterium]|nr:hypothetical protein [Treponemataceae bacterium]
MKMSGRLLCALLLFLRLPCCSQASDIVLTGPELEAVRAELQSMRSEVQLLQGLLTKQSGSSEILQARCRTLEDELREALLSLERSGQKAVELQKTQEQ